MPPFSVVAVLSSANQTAAEGDERNESRPQRGNTSRRTADSPDAHRRPRRTRYFPSAQDIAEALDDPDPPRGVKPLIGLPSAVGADATTDEILAKLGGRGGTGLPVLNEDHTALIGWITYEAVLAKLRPNTTTPGPTT